MRTQQWWPLLNSILLQGFFFFFRTKFLEKLAHQYLFHCLSTVSFPRCLHYNVACLSIGIVFTHSKNWLPTHSIKLHHKWQEIVELKLPPTNQYLSSFKVPRELSSKYHIGNRLDLSSLTEEGLYIHWEAKMVHVWKPSRLRIRFLASYRVRVYVPECNYHLFQLHLLFWSIWTKTANCQQVWNFFSPFNFDALTCPRNFAKFSSFQHFIMSSHEMWRHTLVILSNVECARNGWSDVQTPPPPHHP